MKSKLNIEDKKQLAFLKENLRNLYTKEILDWQYLRWECSSSLYLTIKNDEYIASQGMIPIYLTHNGKTKLTAKSETSFLLPAYRGKGLFEELYDYTIVKSEEDNCEFIWGFTPLSKVWRKKLKFGVYDGLISETSLQLNFKISIFSVFKEETSIFNKFKNTLKTVFLLLKKKPISKPSLYSAKELNLNSNRVIEEVCNVFELWKNKNKDFVSINTDSDYLKWRIVNNPIMKYKLLGVYKENVLVGYGIVNNLERGGLVEFIVPEAIEIEVCLLSLLQYIKKENKQSHISYWASNLNGYNKKIHAILIKLGARSHKNLSMNFVYKDTKHISFETSDISKFYINGLWTEGFKM